MRAIDLAYNDLLQVVRDWQAALFLVVMPIAFTLLFGFLFGGFSAGDEEDPRLPVGFQDLDGGVLASHIHRFLEASAAVRPVTPEDGDDLEKMVGDGDLAAAVIIPAGFTTSVMSDAMLPVIVIVDTSTNAGFAAQGEIQAVMNRLQSAVQTARLSTQAHESELAFADGGARQAYFASAIEQSLSAWNEPPLVVDARMATVSEEPDESLDNAFAHSSPGMMAQFAIAGLIGAASVIVLERKNRALSRLLTTSISRVEIILGHYMAMVVMILAQFTLLIVFGQLLLRLDYFSQPLATISVSLAAVLCAASMGLLIGTLAKTEEQVVIFTLVPMFVLSGLGGAWVPLEFTSETVQSIGHFSPVAWIMDGYKNILLRGAGLEESMVPVAVEPKLVILLSHNNLCALHGIRLSN
jgi:ABC-2 type transport system permease protein